MKNFDMGLIAPDVFDVTIPSTGQVVQLHPFVMKQYKALMIAKEGGDLNKAIIQAVNMCISGGENLDVETMPIQDIEYLFIQLYMSSTGSVDIPVKYKCNHKHDDDSECDEILDAWIHLQDTWVPKSDSDGKLMINKKVGIQMKYPTLGILNKHDTNTADGMLNMVLDCVDYIFTENEQYTPDELGSEQFAKIMEQLTGHMLGELSEYIGSVPRITNMIKLKCPKCGQEHEIVLSGIEDFFM